MNIIINHSSMVPIYEQIVNQIKKQILSHELKENTCLPSVRSLANELKISALTVKKAYDFLEDEGLILTIHGKGSYIKSLNQNVLEEELKKEIQNELESTLSKARQIGLSKKDIMDLFEIIWED
ncbi:MAG: GntR family transcriptional regulator [Holdemanella porci]